MNKNKKMQKVHGVKDDRIKGSGSGVCRGIPILVFNFYSCIQSGILTLFVEVQGEVKRWSVADI